MTGFLDAAIGSPLIVCGNPRSGTRMHANVLNAHPEILITDEFHGVDRLRQLLSEFRRNDLLKKFARPQAMERQAFVAKMLWLAYSVDHIAERGACVRIIGNKTPQIERKYQILENVFHHAPPRYVYCLRSAPKVLRSVKNLKNLRWNRDTVETNLRRYVGSVRCLEEMKAAFPDRVCVSVLDHLRPGTRNSDFFEGVFRFAGVELTEAVRAQIDAMGAQNTMDAVRTATGTRGTDVVELSAEEQALIRDSTDYAAIRRQYDLAG